MADIQNTLSVSKGEKTRKSSGEKKNKERKSSVARPSITQMQKSSLFQRACVNNLKLE